MALVHKCSTLEGKPVGWMIFCPACGCCHLFDARWTFNGDLKRPSFQPPLVVNGDGKNGPRCHSVVTDGKIQYMPDCGHALAGKTADVPDLNEELRNPKHVLNSPEAVR